MKRIQAERSVLGAVGATVLALNLLVAWTRQLQIGWLFAAIVAYVIAAALTGLVWRRRVAPAALLLALGVLLLGAGSATLLSWRFAGLDRDWPGILERRDARLGRELNARMADVAQRGHAAADQAAAIAASRTASTDMFRPLRTLLEQHRIDAIALYTDAGGLVAWAGDHRGALPDTIWASSATAYFEERPLFSYIYFPVHVPGRDEHVIAAALVETGVVSDETGDRISDVVEARTRTRAAFRSGGGADAVWSLVIGGDTIVHARLEPLTQTEWRERMEHAARRTVLLTVLIAFIALSAAWLRSTGPMRPVWAAALPLVALLPVVAIAPLRETFAAERLFSPLLFALPPGDVSLGRLVALLLPITALLAGARRSPRPVRRRVLRIAAGAVIIAAAYPLVLHLLLSGTTSALLEGPAAYWYGFQLTVVLVLSMVTLLVQPRTATHDSADGAPDDARRRWLLVGAIGLSVALALAVSFAGAVQGPLRLVGAALWAVPFTLGAVALAPLSGRSGALARLLLAGWLAGTAALPYLWRVHVDAKLASAERELERLGIRADPFLHYLLEEFAIQARARFAGGESGVQLLYRTWVASGLAQQPYPSRIALWSENGLVAGTPDVQLGSAPMPRVVQEGQLFDLLASARTQTSSAVLEFSDLLEMSRLLTVPLADGSLITVMVPPRRTLERTSAIAPFLGVISPGSTRLNLVDVSGPEPTEEFIEWQPSDAGWRSEAFVKYPDGWYHAHLEVAFPPVWVRLARGMLLITFDLALLTLLWIIGVVARGGSALPRGDVNTWLGSFRARITLALFGFFLIPTAVFGWVAYTALSGEVERVAETWAQHSVARVVLEFQEGAAEGAADLRDLAAHAGTDVLRYINGELIDVSAREALDLGVYSAWMPPDIYNRLESGEDLSALATQQLGDQSWITAYHAVRPSGTLGVPMSLSSGDTAVRQREFAHLVLFAAVVGALLSLALSLAVGRELAGPIGQLRRASAAVGAGRFGVQLPEREAGEFGQLFTSFNRMARRLRRARAREIRTARVLAWGEMARQVAHEIKNPLTPIKLAVQHLRRAHADRHPQFDEVLDSNVSQILTEIDRLSEIARAFSRYGAPTLATGPITAVDAPGVIREALTLYRSGDRSVRYIDDVQPDLPRVTARADELKEVLLNLVENARAALDGAGDIVISAYATSDERVEIDIADTGPGIPRELLTRVFEPHFSTRSSGTGLGLAIVRRLVESWGGNVEADSEPGRGTIVRLKLPIAPSG